MTYRTIHADVETKSPVDLKKCGAHVYFEHEHTDVLMCAYRLDDGPLQIWTFDQPCPTDLALAITQGAIIEAWNAAFEHLAFDLLAARRGWPRPHFDQYRDTAAAAAAMSLPRSLGDAAEALGLPVQKDKDGMRLIRKFSFPRKPRANEPPGIYWNEPADHPADWELFKRYCCRDVETEEAAARRIVPLSESEHRLWLLNERSNFRGIRIDTRSARAALRLADKAKARLDREMAVATGGFVRKVSEPGKLVEWVKNQGIELGSATKAEITELLRFDDLPDNVRRALALREEGGKTSVSKLSAMVMRANADDRARGSSMFHAAGTGRFQSQGVNFNNMPRPRKVYEDAHLDTALLFDTFRKEDPDLLQLLYPDTPPPDDPSMAKFLYPNQDGVLGRPLHLISDSIRGFIWSAPGHDFIQADYSGIEGAVIAWLAGEDWKVQALFDIMNDPSLPDMYRQTAAMIMNTTTDVITKKHPLRQSAGKVSELALGFGGGVLAFVSMARNYRVRLEGMFDPIWETASPERREKALKRYDSVLKRGKEGADALSREAWLACELIKVGWRAANPAIAQSWKDLEEAVRNAIRNPGQQFSAARVTYLVAKGFLWARLPSGRCLAYGSPRLKDQVWAEILLPDGSWADAEVMDREAAERQERAGTVKIKGPTSPAITALSVDSTTKKWGRSLLYGGLLAENNTQATARDLLVNGMFKAEAAGYPIVATVYDEILTEVPRGFGDVKEFEALICELPDWAAGLPLTASGWRGKRYRKD